MSSKDRCAWCNPECRGQPISHGICDDCAEEMEAEARAVITRDTYQVTLFEPPRRLTAGEPACQRGIAC